MTKGDEHTKKNRWDPNLFSTKITGKISGFCVSFFAWKCPMSRLQKLWGQRLSKVYENQDVYGKGKPKSKSQHKTWK